MRPAILALGVLAAAHTLSAGGAQNRADAVTGTWTAVAEAPQGIRPAPSPVLGPSFGLDVTGTRAVLRRPIRGETVEVSIPLDGTPGSYRAAARPCEGDQQYFETMVWEDGGLAITRTGMILAGGGPIRPLDVKLLVRPGPGDTLVVEGRMAQRGAEPVPVATVYRRSLTPLPDPPPRPDVRLAAATIATLAWLPGTWSGLNGPLTIEERWTPIASGAMQGMGRTLREHTQVAFEFVCVSERHGGLVYTAWPSARPTPTHFHATSVTTDSVTFENPAHDFPQVIRYTRLPDGSLQTTISATDGSRAQSFTIQKLEHR
ncbi:MAG TPA: DUF6265 family protein [Vicinamibacterales bacterium]|nr:DUF6265 family protein [Vicinamibacterales bacterium]